MEEDDGGERQSAAERLARLYEEPRTARERHYGLMFRDELRLPGPGRVREPGEGPDRD